MRLMQVKYPVNLDWFVASQYTTAAQHPPSHVHCCRCCHVAQGLRNLRLVGPIDTLDIESTDGDASLQGYFSFCLPKASDQLRCPLHMFVVQGQHFRDLHDKSFLQGDRLFEFHSSYPQQDCDGIRAELQRWWYQGTRVHRHSVSQCTYSLSHDGLCGSRSTVQSRRLARKSCLRCTSPAF